MQIDNSERGFSYKKDEKIGMLIENSDEPYAEKITTAILSYYRKGKKM